MKLGKRAKKIIRTTHKYAGRIISVAAPIAGALVGGPAGAALGGAVGTAASYYGEKQGALASGKKGAAVKKAGRRGLKRGAIIGGGVTLGAGALAVAGGTGIATSSITAVSGIGSPGTLFGPASAVLGQSMNKSGSSPGGIENAVTSDAQLGGGAGAAGGSATSDALVRAFGFGSRAADKYKHSKTGEKDEQEGLLDSIKKLFSGKDADGNMEKLFGLPKPVVLIGGAILAVYLLKGAGASSRKAA